MGLILFLLLLPIVILVLIGLVAGFVGLVFGLLRFVIPLILVIAVIRWLTRSNRSRPTEWHDPHTHESHDGQRRTIHAERDDSDNWSDF